MTDIMKFGYAFFSKKIALCRLGDGCAIFTVIFARISLLGKLGG